MNKRISEEEYTKRYNQKIGSNSRAQKVIAGLRRKYNQSQTITLLCKCDDREFCYRHLIKQMIMMIDLNI
jgi:uncharacterized protein YeaO (DUF488 family)